MGTSTDAQLIKECKSMIASAKIDDALHMLRNAVTKSENDLIIIESRWATIKKSKRIGALGGEEYDIGQAKIIQSMMEILEDIERDLSLVNIPADDKAPTFEKKHSESVIKEKQSVKIPFHIYVIVAVIIVVVCGGALIYNSSGTGYNINSNSENKHEIVMEIQKSYHIDKNHDLVLNKIENLINEEKQLFQKLPAKHQISIKKIRLFALSKKYKENQTERNYNSLIDEIEKAENDEALLDTTEKIKKELMKLQKQ